MSRHEVGDKVGMLYGIIRDNEMQTVITGGDCIGCTHSPRATRLLDRNVRAPGNFETEGRSA